MAFIRTKFLLLLLSISIFLPFNVVRGQPKWVKKALEENQSAEISPEAPAVVLFNKTVLQVLGAGVAREKVQRALKVLKPQGAGYADLEITTTPARKVKGVQGWHIDQYGSCRKLDSKNIREINRSQTAGFYDDDMVLTATFIDVAAGDVAAFEYELDIDDSLKDNYYTFTLQYSLPVMETYLEVEIPDGWQIQISEKNLSPLTFRKRDNKSIWEGRNLPYRADEPYMPNWPLGARRLELNCYSPGIQPTTSAPNGRLARNGPGKFSRNRPDQPRNWPTWPHSLPNQRSPRGRNLISSPVMSGIKYAMWRWK